MGLYGEKIRMRKTVVLVLTLVVTSCWAQTSISDSTSTGHGQIEFAANAAQPYDADITAVIDSIGKPHLVTCYSTVGGKPLIFQFRQTYTKSEYDGEIELPREDEFCI